MHVSGSDTHPRGVRVVVRYRLPAPDPASGARHTDVVGQLIDAGPDAIIVAADRRRVSIPRAAVVATRVIPPRPSRRGAPHRALSVEDLERVMVGAWPPSEQEPLGEWVLRAGAGFTARANSALVVGHPDRPLPAALEEVEQWYAARHLLPVLALPMAPGQQLTDDAVAVEASRTGWSTDDPVLVLTGATRVVVAAAQRTAPGPHNGIEVETADRISEDWFTTYARSRTAVRHHVQAVLEGSPAQWFAVARSGSSVLGVGRVGINAGWAGIGAMWVEPQARSQGIGTAVLQALLERALEHGCVSTHLQVESANTAAVGLYRRLGFTDHHAYVYLRRR
ncbi:MAG: GNAT family N-acetyltransferase [Actinomycetia bacterium]|nr:GNAT family N-acetyltransferase [Actinomycetes bacterium]